MSLGRPISQARAPSLELERTGLMGKQTASLVIPTLQTQQLPIRLPSTKLQQRYLPLEKLTLLFAPFKVKALRIMQLQ